MTLAKLTAATKRRAREIVVAVRAVLARGARRNPRIERYAQQSALMMLLRSALARASDAELFAVSQLARELASS